MKILRNLFAITAMVFSLMLISSGIVLAETYQIDPAHSSVGFAVKHLMVSTVRGNFGSYQGSIDFDKAKPEIFNADVTIQANSINTGVENRDTHLKSPDFFDAEKFPAITFKSKKLVPKSDGYDVVGDLTIKGVTKEITVPAWISGPVTGPMGDQVIGISGETTINRQDFGVSWNKTMDQGGAVVDDNVKLIVDLEAHKK